MFFVQEVVYCHCQLYYYNVRSKVGSRQTLINGTLTFCSMILGISSSKESWCWRQHFHWKPGSWGWWETSLWHIFCIWCYSADT